MEKRRKQMAFDIEPELHSKIKVQAARKNISLSLWVCRAINRKLKEETKFDAVDQTKSEMW